TGWATRAQAIRPWARHGHGGRGGRTGPETLWGEDGAGFQRGAAHSAGYPRGSRQRGSASPCLPRLCGDPPGTMGPAGDRHRWPLTTMLLRLSRLTSYNENTTKRQRNCHATVMQSGAADPTLLRDDPLEGLPG